MVDGAEDRRIARIQQLPQEVRVDAVRCHVAHPAEVHHAAVGEGLGRTLRRRDDGAVAAGESHGVAAEGLQKGDHLLVAPAGIDHRDDLQGGVVRHPPAFVLHGFHPEGLLDFPGQGAAAMDQDLGSLQGREVTAEGFKKGGVV